MEPKQLRNLGELFGTDLAGWQIAKCFYLQRAHGLMGIFPALVAETSELIVVYDEDALEEVKKHLPPHESKVTRLMVIVHPETGVGFSLQGDEFAAMKPIRILTREAIDALCQTEGAFRWTPGLLGG